MTLAGPTVDSGTAKQDGMSALLAPSSPVRTNPRMADEDREAAKLVWTLLQAGRKWKNACGFDEAPENWDYFLNRQWPKMRAMGLSMSVVNIIYSTVETFIGHVNDNLPQSVARARNEQGMRTAELATKLLNWSDDINNWTSTLELPTRSTLVTGFSCVRVDWDVTADGMRGEPLYTFVDENTFFASPWTRDPLLSDAAWVMHARNVPHQGVKDQWVERADEIPAGVWDGSLTPLNTGGGSTKKGAEAFTTAEGITTFTTGTDKVDGKNLCTLIETWIKQPDGKLRYLVVCNGIKLFDGQSPYDDEKFPFALFNAIRSKDSCYGYALVKWMKSLQDEINTIHSSMLDQLVYESDNPLVVDLANVTEGEIISNAHGSILINKNPSNFPGYQVLTKQGVQASSFNLEELVVRRMNELTGNVDILRGEHPANVTTLGAMEILRDEANILVRKMSAQFMGGIKRKDELVIGRLRQYLKDERTVRISGKGGGQEIVTVNQKSELNDAGEWEVVNTIPEDFEADVDFTPQPPGGSQARLERSLAYLGAVAEDGRPVVDRQWVLEENEEDPQKVAALMSRLDAQAQAQAKAEAAAGGGEGGGAPNPEAEPMDEQEMTDRVTQLLTGLS